MLPTETGIRAESDVDEEVAKYDRKMRIPNTDKATEAAMNCFTSFVLSKKDVRKLGNRHARLLKMAPLHDAY